MIELFQWVVRASWQASALALLVLTLQWALGSRLAPRWRHALWWIVVLRLCVPVFPSSSFSLYNYLPSGDVRAHAVTDSRPAMDPVVVDYPGVDLSETITDGAAGPEFTPAHRGRVEENLGPTSAPINHPISAGSFSAKSIKPSKWDRWSVACAIWMVGSFLFGVLVIFMASRMNGRLRKSQEIKSPSLNQILAECCSTAGLRRLPRLVENRLISTPCVHGIWFPRLLLPSEMIQRFDADELRLVFLHELAHLKRRDIPVNWLAVVLQATHWFNPVIWFAFHRMRADRELAADDLALRWAGEQHCVQYGETLLKVLQTISAPRFTPGTVAILENKTQLKTRLRAIARFGMVRHWRWTALTAIFLLGCFGLTDALKSKPPESTDAEEIANNVEDESAAKRTFKIQTTVHESKEPLEGVGIAVTVEYYDGAIQKTDSITDEDGVSQIEFDFEGVKELSYTLAKDGYLPLEGIWRKQQIGQIPDQLEIALSPGETIGGQVVDEKGRPVQGAEIIFNHPMHLLIESHPADYVIWSVQPGTQIALTDTDGRWKARCIWPTSKWADLRIRHRDFADEVYSTAITQAMEQEGAGHHLKFDELTRLETQFTLAKGFAVVGTVVDENGNPIQGARVRCFDRQPRYHGEKVAPAWERTTEPDGQFQFSHLPAKNIRFAVIANGYAPFMQEMNLTEDAADLRFALDRGDLLQIKTVDRDGEPVSGVRLSLIDWSIWQGVEWEAVTDEAGRAVWPHAPEEKFLVHFEKEGVIPTSKTLQGGEDREIEVARMLKIIAQVVDAKTMNPISAFDVVYADRSEAFKYQRNSAIGGRHGEFTLDLSNLYADGWAHNYFYECVLQVEAEGYEPQVSRKFSSRDGDTGEVQYRFELERAEMIYGVVTDPAGSPLEGAEIALVLSGSTVRLAPGERKFLNPGGTIYSVTGPGGRFKMRYDPKAHGILAVHDEGVTMASMEELNTSNVIVLEKWARVEGTAWQYDKSLAEIEVHMSCQLSASRQDLSYRKVTTDSNGRFIFENVPPGKCRLYRMIPMPHGASSSPAQTVYLDPGETKTVKLGGRGRPVVGHVKVMNPYVKIDWLASKDRHWARTVRPKVPEGLEGREEIEAWRQSDEIRKAYDAIRNHPMIFQEDGSFRIDEMIPGQYNMSIHLYDPRETDAFAFSRYIAKFDETFEVPKADPSNTTVPLDIGEFELWLQPNIEEGETDAPAFSAQGIGSEDFTLSDFRGKYVVLDFWATWCAPCIAELPYLRKVHQEFGGRDDFVLVSLSVDKQISEPESFVSKNDMPWLHGYLGEWGKIDVTKQYGVDGIPAIFLINPEGKIIDKDLRGQTLIETLKKQLP